MPMSEVSKFNGNHNSSMTEQLRAHVRTYGQEHLLEFWDQLSVVAKNRLADQIRQVDFSELQQLYEGKTIARDFAELASRAKQPPAIRLRSEKNPVGREEAVAQGVNLLEEGQVGMILVAGGQGSRLGFPHPKGMFPLGPLSERTLFQIIFERLQAVGKRYNVRIPLYLMTSPATHDETVAFLDQHERFGLPQEDLMIFCQGTMPAVDAAEGRVLLAETDSLALSPDGHGGMLAAMQNAGCLDDSLRRGLEVLFYQQVDNPMVSVCDPEFLGYHVLAGSELSSQVITKREPKERVGVVVAVDHRLEIVEYSDLPDEMAEMRDGDGSLYHWAGSIAVHAFDVNFLVRMVDNGDALPFHKAHKQVSYVNSAGKRIDPDSPNAIKFERFIFDLLPAAERAIVVEIDPAEGFEPVKNGDGKKETPETARLAMARQHRQWLRVAGATVPDDVLVEINPLFALDADELALKIQPGMQINKPTYFQ